MAAEVKMTLHISDQAEEFRIDILGSFIDAAVKDAAIAWKAALLANTPRRISVDITGMTSYDHAGYRLLREMLAHGTHIVAGTPKSLKFFNEISGPQMQVQKRQNSKQVVTMQPRAAAAGE